MGRGNQKQNKIETLTFSLTRTQKGRRPPQNRPSPSPIFSTLSRRHPPSHFFFFSQATPTSPARRRSPLSQPFFFTRRSQQRRPPRRLRPSQRRPQFHPSIDGTPTDPISSLLSAINGAGHGLIDRPHRSTTSSPQPENGRSSFLHRHRPELLSTATGFLLQSTTDSSSSTTICHWRRRRNP